jgi:glycosyltransferase involved in cell wall biosynthesis
MVGAPPDGVVYSWKGDGAAQSPSSALRSVAAASFRLLKIPHVRVERGTGADVVHSCQGLLWCSKPWVVDIEHGSPFVGIHFDRLATRRARRMVAALLEHESCRAILPWTQTAATSFLRTFSEYPGLARKIRVVCPAVRPPQHVPRPSHSGPSRVLFVSNAPPWNFVLKGGRELLAACQRLRSTGVDVRVTVAGEVPADIAERWADASWVAFTGRVPREDLHRLYEASDVFAMPSLSDTFGMVFLEAMAHALPVVALDRPYTREIIRDNETGLLIPLASGSVRWLTDEGSFTMNSDVFVTRVLESEVEEVIVDGLVDRLGRLVADEALRRRLGDNGRAEILTGRFSVRTRNEALVQVYEHASRMREGR